MVDAFPYKVAQFENIITKTQIDLFSDKTVEVYFQGGRARLGLSDHLHENITAFLAVLERFDGLQVLGDANSLVENHFRVEYLSERLERRCEIKLYPMANNLPSMEGAYETLPAAEQRKYDLLEIFARFSALYTIEDAAKTGLSFAELAEKMLRDFEA